MKKLVKSVLMLSIASLAILSSCKKEDDNGDVTNVSVTITASPSDALVQTGTVLTLTIECTGNTDNKLKKITVTSTQGSAALLSKTLSTNSSTEIVRDTLLLPNTTYSYTVTVEGEKGTPATKTYTVKTRAPYGLTTRTANAIELLGQTQGSDASSFIALSNPITPFSFNEFDANKGRIDLGFFYGTNSGYKLTLSVPQDTFLRNRVFSSLNFAGTKTVKLAKTTLTAAQFDVIAAAINDSAIVNYEGANPQAGWNLWRVDNLKAGDVLAFVNGAGKMGFVKVTTAFGTEAGDAKVELEVVAQAN
ncbi:MAG: hypothetical protein V4590_04255 [Bacteroidota bacterium]